MADAKHTPGPWIVDPRRSDTVLQALGPPLARAYAPRYFGSRDGKKVADAHANARLIAAAPELYEALDAMVEAEVDYMSRNNLGDPERQHNVRRARAALAKARKG